MDGIQLHMLKLIGMENIFYKLDQENKKIIMELL